MQAVGTIRPASKILSSFSCSTGRESKKRSEYLFFAISKKSIMKSFFFDLPVFYAVLLLFHQIHIYNCGRIIYTFPNLLKLEINMAERTKIWHDTGMAVEGQHYPGRCYCQDDVRFHAGTLEGTVPRLKKSLHQLKLNLHPTTFLALQ